VQSVTGLAYFPGSDFQLLCDFEGGWTGQFALYQGRLDLFFQFNAHL
jgi:hypothetical protein